VPNVILGRNQLAADLNDAGPRDADQIADTLRPLRTLDQAGRGSVAVASAVVAFVSASPSLTCFTAPDWMICNSMARCSGVSAFTSIFNLTPCA
jgi:hypothetical protein